VTWGEWIALSVCFLGLIIWQTGTSGNRAQIGKLLAAKGAIVYVIIIAHDTVTNVLARYAPGGFIDVLSLLPV
jgi:uncharacterized protein YqgC (DUF456 family)